MSDSNAIDIPLTLRIVACPVCSISHALPRDLHLAAIQGQGPLHCPNGHAWTPLPVGTDPASNPVQSAIEAAAALVDARRQLQAAMVRVAELEAALKGRSPLDRKEIGRRALFLANRAPSMGYGRKECPICKRERRGTFLVEHMRREHAQSLADYPAEMFEPNTANAAAR